MMLLARHLGDCLDVMPTLPTASVDLILCDLPYEATENRWDVMIPFEPLWKQYWRIAKPNAAVVLTATQPFTSMCIMSQPKTFKYEWVWEKNNPSGHLNAKKRPMRVHEDVLVFCAGTPRYIPQMTQGHPLKQATRLRFSTNYGAQKVNSYASTERYPRSVQKINGHPKADTIHPTQKPVALMEYLIRTYTKPGEVVLDNCMGSGTTGVAAVQSGRAFIGIERDADCFALADRRIEAAATLCAAGKPVTPEPARDDQAGLLL